MIANPPRGLCGAILHHDFGIKLHDYSKGVGETKQDYIQIFCESQGETLTASEVQQWFLPRIDIRVCSVLYPLYIPPQRRVSEGDALP